MVNSSEGQASKEERAQRAWQEELAFMRKRARKTALGRPRTWTREELYDDRRQRPDR